MSVCRKITDWYVCLMLLLFPLFTGFRGYSAVTNSKFFFFVIASLLWLLAVLCFALRGKVRFAELPFRDADILFLGAFVLISIISSLLSPWFPGTLLGAGRWDGLVTTLLYAAVYLGIRCFGETKAHHLWCLGISVLLCTAVGIGQLFGGNPLHLFPESLDYFDAHILYSGEFLGTIGNVDILAAYLCLAVPSLTFSYVMDGKDAPLLLPAAAGMFLLLESGVKSGLVGLGFCVMVAVPLLVTERQRLCRCFLAAAVLLAASAAAMLLRFEAAGLRVSLSLPVCGLLFGLLLCMGLAFVFHRRSTLPDRSEGFYRRIFLLLVLLLILGGLAFLWIYPGESGTIYELSRILHGELREDFGSSRIRIWRETLLLVRERPLLGGGTGSVASRLNIHFSRLVPETGGTMNTYVDNAHNIYLTVLSDTGIPGLLAYLGMLVSVFARWLHSRRHALCAALGCAVLAYCAEEFFGLGLCISAPLFWITLGLCAVRTRSIPDAPEESSPPEAQE